MLFFVNVLMYFEFHKVFDFRDSQINSISFASTFHQSSQLNLCLRFILVRKHNLPAPLFLTLWISSFDDARQQLFCDNPNKIKIGSIF